jgi:PUA domain protein
MKLKGRYFARKDLVLEIRRGLSGEFVKLLPSDARVEVVDTDEGSFILVNGEVTIFKPAEEYFPTVKGALKINVDKRFVTVDKGAIPFIAKGADVMRPGVVAFDEGIKKGELVVINEETHKKALAIGIALWSGEEFKSNKSGKCVKVIHHVGDELWNFSL